MFERGVDSVLVDSIDADGALACVFANAVDSILVFANTVGLAVKTREDADAIDADGSLAGVFANDADFQNSICQKLLYFAVLT